MPISVNLGSKLEKRLNKLAKLTGRTKTYYIRRALAQKLAELEDIYVAEKRLESSEKRWSMEEIEKGDDLEGRVA